MCLARNIHECIHRSVAIILCSLVDDKTIMALQHTDMASFSKSVPKMAVDDDDPPASYVVKESKFGSIDSSPPYSPFPVIDMDLFAPNSCASETQVRNELGTLSSALSSAGCFQAISASEKSLEEMSTNGEHPPPEYIVKETKFGTIESSPPLGPFPLIDMGLFSESSSEEEIEHELGMLRSALSSAGCFQVIGHGISNSFLDKVREAAIEFFTLPIEEKQKYGRAVNEAEGYGSDRLVSENQVHDWCHRLSLRVFPEDQRRLNLWPQNPTEFREILNEYATKIKIVTEVLFKAIAKSLKLEENSFLNQFGDQALMQARFNFYPPCSRPDLVHGVKPHTDRSGITILLQDQEVEGLQICIDGKWYRVPVIPHALVVNLGDQMQIMTNGIYKSPMHRVVTNTKKLRISLASFIEPEPENEIGPVDQLIDEQRLRVYRNVKNYGAVNYECYQKGLVALETVKV